MTSSPDPWAGGPSGYALKVSRLALLALAALQAACGTQSGTEARSPDTGAAESHGVAVDAGDVEVREPEDASADAPAGVGPSEGDTDTVDVSVPDDSSVSGDVGAPRCRPAEQALENLALPEASGAARLDGAGDRLLFVSDSGNLGQALILQRQTGAARALELPLGSVAGDDIEGLARTPKGTIVGLTSAGWIREWSVDGDALSLVGEAYPIADQGSDWVCEPASVNCGKNYEGVCLHPAPLANGCAGFAASKTEGRLVCLVAAGTRYRVDPSVTIDVAAADQISGCAFAPDPPHRLVVAGNLYTLSAIWEVIDHQLPAAASVQLLPVTGSANQEALVWAGTSLYSAGDLQGVLGDASPIARFECGP